MNDSSADGYNYGHSENKDRSNLDFFTKAYFFSTARQQHPIDAPMTQEEREFLLNDSILRVPTPKQTSENLMKMRDLSPTTLMLVRTIGGLDCKWMIRVLLDSGGTYTLVNKKAIPENAVVKSIHNGKSKTTVAGEIYSQA